KGEGYSLTALKLAGLEADIATAASRLSEFYGVLGRHRDGLDAIDANLSRLSGRALATALRAKVDNRLHAQDFTAALATLSEVERVGGTSESWLQWRRELLRTAVGMQAEREAFY